jgi:hypothetical protein
LDFSFHIPFLRITVPVSSVTIQTNTNFSTRFVL